LIVFGQLPKVACYAAEVNQVLMNLMRNAAESIDGEGTISVDTSACDRGITIAISDTGRGIPPEQIPRLFDPGFSRKGPRVRASVSLFTSRNIIEKHGGEIHVTSQPGAGATFSVLLPLAASAVPA